jgi:citrate synthase
MPPEPKPIRSDISWSTSDRISVRGLDLPGEILGHMDIGEFSFLQITGRRPTRAEAVVYNAIIVTLIEHGMTPSAIAARLTYTGAPESLQAAIAAGISGLGTVFVGSMEGAARMLYEALPLDAEDGVDLGELAKQVVADYRSASRIIPGLGHPLHKPIDPRTPRLFEIAAENGLTGRHAELVQLIAAEAERVSGRSLPINATGAIGALCCELGFPWQIVRGFGVMARAIGLVGHLLEERERPVATEIWRRTEEEASAHARPS